MANQNSALVIAEKTLKICMFSGSGIPELHSSHLLLPYSAVLQQKPVPTTETGVSQSWREHWTALKWAHFWPCLKHHLKG